jgi:hypothetical protein
MINRTRTALVLSALACGLAIGCSASPSAPTAIPLDVPGGTLLGVSLFGVVSEVIPTGLQPIKDITVSCDWCGRSGHARVITDANGNYRFSGDIAQGGGIWVRAGSSNLVVVITQEYVDPPGTDYAAVAEIDPLMDPAGARAVMINGDTRFDIQLVRIAAR